MRKGQGWSGTWGLCALRSQCWDQRGRLVPGLPDAFNCSFSCTSPGYEEVSIAGPRLTSWRWDEKWAEQCWGPTHCGGQEQMTSSLGRRSTFTEAGKMADVSVDMRSQKYGGWFSYGYPKWSRIWISREVQVKEAWLLSQPLGNWGRKSLHSRPIGPFSVILSQFIDVLEYKQP